MTPADVRALVDRLRDAQMRSPVGKDWVGIFGEAADALESLLADRERLDWLEKEYNSGNVILHVWQPHPIEGWVSALTRDGLRESIDAAREGER